MNFPTPDSLSPQTWVEIEPAAVARNLRRFAAALPPGVKAWAAVKKEAYGHGLIEIARALEPEPALAGFGVASVAEGLALRRSGVAAPILVMAVARGDALAAAIRARLTLTITTREDLTEADAAANQAGLTALAHWKIDTGMGRLGRRPEEVLPWAKEFPNVAPRARIEGVYSHFADGWNDPASAHFQAAALQGFADKAGAAGLGELAIHAGGSDALALGADYPFGAARAGIALYGYHPALPDLEPAMAFKTRVIYRRPAPAGSRISYGGDHILARDSELALIGAGYGNGYLRALSGKGEVLIRGRRYPILGRVCMDQCVVDVTGEPEIAPGEEVVLFGKQGAAALGADEAAARAGTIAYELLCLAGGLNPRRYLPPER